MLALKDANGTQGSKLNYSSWDEYPHYGMTDLTTMSSEDDAVAQAIIDMAYLPVNTKSVYQNFDAVTKIKNVVISWSSSDESIIKVTDIAGTSNSKHEDVKVQVIRPTDGDKQVTLTATVKVGGVTKTRTFPVTVKKNTFRLGEFLIEGLDGDAIIVDKGETATEFRPKIPQITNGTSDNNDVIDNGGDEQYFYVRNRSVKLAKVAAPDFNNPSDFTNEPRFDATKPGIWQVTETITFNDGVTLAKSKDGTGIADKTVSKSYLIYVADKGANVDFMNEKSTLAVNNLGYTLSGDFTSPTGTIYALSLPASESAPDAAAIKANEKTEKYEFRATGETFQFTTANEADYNVYYFLENVNADKQSQVYEKAVKTVAISTKAEFEAMLASNDNQTIYLLQKDIDLEGSVATTDEPFVGVFNGLGHKIHNAEIKKTKTDDKVRTGLFRVVKGGSIMNVTFENIVIEDIMGKAERTGIIATIRGGYLGNIKVHNCDVTGIARVGALVGQVLTEASDGFNTTIIDRISVTSDKDKDSGEYLHKIYATNQRAGAVIGYIQAGDAAYHNIVYVSNCFVDTYIQTDTSYCGGILGRCDDRNAKDYLEITNCLFIGELKSPLHCGGIVGGISGTGKTRIFSCVGYGKMTYSKEFILLESAEKNCSNIVGNCGSNADAIVRNCFAKFDEYNSNFNVTTFGAYDESSDSYAPQITQPDFWTENMTSYSTSLLQFCSAQWDFDNVWELESDSNLLKAPYVRLK